jgi:chitinase
VGEWCLKNINVGKASEHVDFINLMCYDFAGPWTELSGHQSQLYAPSSPLNAFARRSAHGAVKYMLTRGVPSRKIVLGIPLYGRSFLGVDGVGQRFTGHAGEGGTFEYGELPPSDAREFVDEQLVAAGSVGTESGFVSYDTPSTVRLKAQYVKANNLGGLFYWTGVADAPGPRSLVHAGYQELSNF